MNISIVPAIYQTVLPSSRQTGKRTPFINIKCTMLKKLIVAKDLKIGIIGKEGENFKHFLEIITMENL